VFETMLVAAGQPLELDAHLDRLVSSTAALFGADPPEEARDLVLEHASELELGRLRLDVAPDADGALAPAVRTAEVDGGLVFPSWERAVELWPVAVEGGIGGHKWSDRRLLDLAQQDAGEALPLVVDSDGTVLEVARGNVFVVRGGMLVTPPADGRLLPGVARRRVLELGLEAREEPVSLDDLAGADEVFATGSVRGVEPVRSCAGVGAWPEGEVTARVSAALRGRWLDSPTQG
jgi:para-aminobenzoate synthetase / 4-amino-4-deoxychorismate lyase